MRPILATVLLVGAFAIRSPEAEAQYAPVPLPGTVYPYRHVVPARPVYAPPFVMAAPRYYRAPNPTGYVNRPYYGAYGYGNYSNGSTDGFPPFRGHRSR